MGLSLYPQQYNLFISPINTNLNHTNLNVVEISDHKIDLLKFYQLNSSFYPILLESVSENSKLANFDILFLDPKDTITLNNHYELTSDTLKFNSNDFLNELDQLYQIEKATFKDNYYPFYGGWFVFLAYEIVKQIEPTLKLSGNKSSTPIASATRFKSALIYDHSKSNVMLISESSEEITLLENKVRSDLETLKHEINQHECIKVLNNKIIEDISKQFVNSVGKIKNYILEGDVFQVNLSRNWKCEVSGKNLTDTSSQLYASLRKTNPAPFSCLAKIKGNCIISSSPERLVKVHDNKVESRPIAGTHPRGINDKQDKELQHQLHKHPKERSEHVMLIDLIRNDLGRVCKPGSIKVNEFMVNESYQTVHHIVSNVIGELDDTSNPGNILKAMFPGGTITGCPKVRCMQIIAELEQAPREAYTGSLGYINRDGSMDFNILIRTMLLKSKIDSETTTSNFTNLESKPISKFSLNFRTGAGLVNDSIAENEVKETHTKALGLINAISKFFKD